MNTQQKEAAARHFCKLNGWDPDKPVAQYYLIGDSPGHTPKWKHLLEMTGGSFIQNGESVPFNFASFLQMIESVIEAMKLKETVL